MTHLHNSKNKYLFALLIGYSIRVNGLQALFNVTAIALFWLSKLNYSLQSIIDYISK